MVIIWGAVSDLNFCRRSWLRVEVSLEPESSKPRAQTYAAPDGHFRMELHEVTKPCELNFEVWEEGRRLHCEWHDLRFALPEIYVTLEIDSREPGTNDLVIADLDELRRREAEVLERIRTLPNGGWLFFLNPLRTLSECGVHLTAASERQFREHFRFSGQAGRAAYDAVRTAEGRQTACIHLRRLFREECP